MWSLVCNACLLVESVLYVNDIGHLFCCDIKDLCARIVPLHSLVRSV